MIDQKVFNENLELLKKLFPQEFNENLIEVKRKIFYNTETDWEKNICRFTNKAVRYLLICEAPPDNGEYFYSNFNKSLFNKVWETFFSIPKGINSDEAYQYLADIGFLLVDSLPYSMDYSKERKRNLPEYDILVENCLGWWQQKLEDNFIINDKTIIALGFKINAEKIINITHGKLSHNRTIYPLVKDNIVADSTERWQPSIKKLKSVFNP